MSTHTDTPKTQRWIDVKLVVTGDMTSCGVASDDTKLALWLLSVFQWYTLHGDN